MKQIGTVVLLALLGASASGCAAIVGDEGGSAQGSAAATKTRTYVSGRFALDLQGGFAGFVKSVDGGNIKANVISEPAGPDNVAIEPLEIELDIAMGAAMIDWINGALDHDSTRKSGALSGVDLSGARQLTTFTDASLTRITFPALDASSTEPPVIRVELAPTKLGGPLLAAAPKTSLDDPRLGKPVSTFHVEIGDLPMSGVRKIEGMVVKTGHEGQAVPGRITDRTMTVTLGPEALHDWQAWFKASVSGSLGAEKSGRIVLIRDSKKLAAIELGGMTLGSLAEVSGSKDATATISFKTIRWVCLSCD